MCRQKEKFKNWTLQHFQVSEPPEEKPERSQRKSKLEWYPERQKKVFQETGSSAVKYCQWVKEDED